MVRKAEDRRYSFKNDATPPPAPTTGFTEDYIVNPTLDIPTQIIRPKWHATGTGPPRARNVFRILPIIDPDTGELMPCRYSEEPGDYGSWIYGSYLADNIGVKNVCFLMGDNRYVDETTLADTPLAELHSNLVRAFKVGEARPEWSNAAANLIQIGRRDFKPGSKSRPPLITRPKFCYMFQVAVVSHENKPDDVEWYGINDDDPTCILIVSANAGMNLIAQLDNNPDVDPIDLAGGCFIDVHSVDNPPPEEDPPVISVPASKNELGYAITLLSEFNGITPKLDHRAQDVLKHVRWWDDLVYVPTIEEQVQLICDSDLPASAIMYALGDDFNSYIPNTLKEAGQRARQARATAQSVKPNIPTQDDSLETQPITTMPGKQSGETVTEFLKRAREAKQQKQ
jgi:hypothetical protein